MKRSPRVSEALDAYYGNMSQPNKNLILGGLSNEELSNSSHDEIFGCVGHTEIRFVRRLPSWATILLALISELESAETSTSKLTQPSHLFGRLRIGLLKIVGTQVKVPKKMIVSDNVIVGVAESILQSWADLLSCSVSWKPSEKLSHADNWRRFLDERPYVARLFAERAALACNNISLLLSRLETDIEPISNYFSISNNSLLNVFSVDQCGDLHNEGQSAQIIQFTNGTKLVYKPRSGSSAEWVKRVHDEVFKDLPSRSRLKFAKSLNRRRYVWEEFIEKADCRTGTKVEDFYRRVGTLLALSQLARIGDLHNENVLASGAFPVPVDLEVVGTPSYRLHNVRPTARVPTNVAASGLLPTARETVAGTTRVESTFFTNHGDSRELDLCTPTLNQVAAPIEEFAPVVVSGYTQAARTIAQEYLSGRVSDALEAARDALPRFVARSTSLYAHIRREATRKCEFLGTTEAQAFIGIQLNLDGLVTAQERKICREEIWALTHWDIPIFNFSDTCCVRANSSDEYVNVDLSISVCSVDCFNEESIEKSADTIRRRISLLSRP